MRYTEVVDIHLQNLKIDKAFESKLDRFVKQIIYRQPNIELMSSSVLGVASFSITDADINEYFSILNVSKKMLESDITRITDIPSNFMVPLNPVNIITGSLLHKIATSSYKSESLMKSVIMFLSLRFFSSTYNAYFTRPLSEKDAKAVYNSMDYRYDLKKYGSNFVVINKRAEDLYKYYNKRFPKNTTKHYTYFISDVSGRMRTYLKGWFRAHERINIDEASMRVSSMVQQNEEGTTLRDVIDNNAIQYTAIKHILINNITNDDVLELTVDLMRKTNKKYILEIHNSVQKHLQDPNMRDHVFKLFDTIVSCNVDYIYYTKLHPPYHKNLSTLFKNIRNIWTASRIGNKGVLYVKEELYKLTKDDISTKTKHRKQFAVISFVCYIYILTVLTAEKDM